MSRAVAPSYLHVPGKRPDRFARACRAGAEALIAPCRRNGLALLPPIVTAIGMARAAQSGDAAVAVGGKVIDRPILGKAERIGRDAGARIPR